MNTFHLPNTIFELDLKPVEILVYAGLVRLKNKRTRATIVSCRALSNLCGISIETTYKASKSLENKGLVHIRKRNNYVGHYIAKEYKITKLCSRGFFIVPNKAFNYNLGKSEFSVLLFMIKCMNSQHIAIPSLSQIAKGLKITISTITKSLNILYDAKLLIKNAYLRLDNSLGHNRYLVAIVSGSMARCRKIHKKYKAVTVSVKKAVFDVLCAVSNKLDIVLEFNYILGNGCLNSKVAMLC